MKLIKRKWKNYFYTYNRDINTVKINIFLFKKVYPKEEWELKFIVSELTIKFLILHKKDVNENDIGESLQFLDWQCDESLYEDIGDYLDENYSLNDN